MCARIKTKNYAECFTRASYKSIKDKKTDFDTLFHRIKTVAHPNLIIYLNAMHASVYRL